MGDYPAELIRTRYLFDGTEVTIRPIRAEDAVMEQDFVRHLSKASRYARFMGTLNELPPGKLRYLTELDYQRHMALVATVIRDGQELEIGVARYVVSPDGSSCEFAVTVDDAWQGSGVAGLLMLDLMDVARTRGLTLMEGFALAANDKMLKFARQLGFTIRRDPDDRETVHLVRTL
ncbi:GNAT family N-acetyltransferase [Azoarcus sp. L1K30]|uniref:GNAT family N-acetyltransferase n=1 Tax=Azoarcus sp. L1K30 TaxID=2820277 RepID=UPI001B819BB6|nr:GNAT family N-acetyltransferase [Azoarcus sp. L1K30]